MYFSKILTISGKPGLFKVVSQTKTGVLVESLIDKRRIPVFSNDKISSLGEISIFTDEGDLELKQVLKTISEKENKALISGLKEKSEKEILAYFLSIVPNYDQEKVYVSDMKKILNWYNLLCQNEIVDFEEAEEETEEIQPSEETPQ